VANIDTNMVGATIAEIGDGDSGVSLEVGDVGAKPKP
jgi:hypothetical protein